MKVTVTNVRFREGACLGNGGEIFHALHPNSVIANKPCKFTFDKDERFLRVESANECVDLVPFENIASLRVQIEK